MVASHLAMPMGPHPFTAAGRNMADLQHSQLGAHPLPALALTQIVISKRKLCPGGLGTLAQTTNRNAMCKRGRCSEEVMNFLLAFTQKL